VFVFSLLGLGAFLHFFARRALTQKIGRLQPFCWREGSLTAVAIFLVWVWGATQTLSAIFSQTLADGSVPSALVDAFSGVSALQFRGITQPPACTPDSDPFLALRTAAGVGFGVVVVGAVCVLSLALGRRAAATVPPPLLVLTTRSVLLSCVVILHVAYGALASVAVDALACKSQVSLPVRMYTETLGDGTAITAAFGGALNMTILRAAAKNPILAQRAGLTDVLSATVNVRLLAADSSIVCGEGPHTAALPVAYALFVLLAGGLPALILCALFGAGKLKGLRRALLLGACPCDARPPKPPAPAPPSASTTPSTRWALINPLAAARSSSVVRTAWDEPSEPSDATEASRAAASAHASFSSAVCGILVDFLSSKNYLPRAQWFPAYDWALTALVTAGASAAATAPTFESYLAYQISMVAALLFSAVLLYGYAPSVKREAWQNNGRAAFYLLASTAAGINALLRRSKDSALALGLCVALLLGAAVVLLLLLYQWRQSLMARGADAVLVPSEATRSVVGRGRGMVVREPQGPVPTGQTLPSVFTKNPLLGAHGISAPEPGQGVTPGTPGASGWGPAPGASGRGQLFDAYRNGAVVRLTRAARGLNLRRPDQRVQEDEEDVPNTWAAVPTQWQSPQSIAPLQGSVALPGVDTRERG
jgi:hypothetical protein